MEKIKTLLNQRDHLKSQINHFIEQSKHLDESTIKGGIFAISKTAEGDEGSKPGSARWIRQRSKLLLSIEDKLRDLDLPKTTPSTLCLQNTNFENILFQVQSGQILENDEIASQLLLLCINMLVMNHDNETVVTKLKEIIHSVKIDFLQ